MKFRSNDVVVCKEGDSQLISGKEYRICYTINEFCFLYGLSSGYHEINFVSLTEFALNKVLKEKD